MTARPRGDVPARLWHPLSGGSVRCDLCHHRCQIDPGQAGLCGVRVNREGTLVARSYGRLVAANADPVEKKPLFHFHPGSRAFSVATAGCNLHCDFCQNWSISQYPVLHPGSPLPGDVVGPEEIVAAAERTGCATIAYTYTEPTVFWELVVDTAARAHAAGVANALVTNGYMTPDALDLLGDHLDAANVDLKGADPHSLEAVTGARPGPVRRNIRTLRERGVWVEVTTLIVPGLNDDERALRSIASFLASVDPDIPWHVSRFHPDYKMRDRSPTDADLLARACDWGEREGLRYVYTGNLWGDDHESTRCPSCGQVVLERHGFRLGQVRLRDGRCVKCQASVAGVGLP